MKMTTCRIGKAAMWLSSLLVATAVMGASPGGAAGRYGAPSVAASPVIDPAALVRKGAEAAVMAQAAPQPVLEPPALQQPVLDPSIVRFIVVLNAAPASADKGKNVSAGGAEVSTATAAEPDYAALRATVEQKWRNRRVITMPTASVDAALVTLMRDPNVRYVQRVYVGNPLPPLPTVSTDPTTTSNGLKRQSDSTPPTWSSGNYAYDGSGNIKAVGSNGYVYDSAGRLVQSSTNGTTETYTYDSFGNMTSKATAGAPMPIPVDPSTNRMVGVAYDAAGNATLNGTDYYWYDSGNQMREKAVSLDQIEEYVYTADDERIGIRDGPSMSWRWMLRDFDGKVLREYESYDGGDAIHTPWLWVEDHVYRDGQLASGVRESAEGGTRQFHLDHLGTPRLITNASGMQLAAHDDYPFGMEQTNAYAEVTDHAFERTEPMNFTGHERDLTGLGAGNYLDYMHARYYSASVGRFLSVDPVLGRQREPQSWNRYAYALNNPLRYTDPDGRWVTNCSANDKQCNAEAAAFEASLNNDLKSKDSAVVAAAQAYGAKGDASIVVGFGTTGKDAGTTTPVLQGNADGTMGMTATVMLKSGLSGTDLNAAVAHEGQHLLDAQGFVATFTKNAASWDISKNLTSFQTEMNAYRLTNSIFSSARQPYSTGCNGCTLGGSSPRTPADVDLAIKRILADPNGAYKVTPQNQGQRQFPEWTTPPPQP